MAPYILTMNCVSGDGIQVAIYRREDIVRWLRTLDHEGSSWDVVYHNDEDGVIEFITQEIETEYGNP